MMTRDEHLAWAKERALEYVDQGDLTNALASIASDLNKHPETRSETTDVLIGTLGFRAATMGNAAEMRRLIEGFN